LKQLTLGKLQTLVQAMGFETKREIIKSKTPGEEDTAFRAAGYRIVVFVTSPKIIEMYGTWTDLKPTLAQVNDWNSNNRFGRAYLDSDGDGSIASDFDLEGGVTKENIEEFILNFRGTVVRFVRSCLDLQAAQGKK
jgi:hypothetical protein